MDVKVHCWVTFLENCQTVSTDAALGLYLHVNYTHK